MSTHNKQVQHVTLDIFYNEQRMQLEIMGSENWPLAYTITTASRYEAPFSSTCCIVYIVVAAICWVSLS